MAATGRSRVPPLPKPPRKALPYAKVLAKFTRSWLTPTVLEAQKAALQANSLEMEEFLEGRHPEVQREQSAKRMALVHSGHFPGRFSLTGRKGAAICQWNLEMNWKGCQAALSARSNDNIAIISDGQRRAQLQTEGEATLGHHGAVPARNAPSRQIRRRSDAVLRLRVLSEERALLVA